MAFNEGMYSVISVTYAFWSAFLGKVYYEAYYGGA